MNAPGRARRTTGRTTGSSRPAAHLVAWSLAAVPAALPAQSTIVPGAGAVATASGAIWMPGFDTPLRLQILIDERHLAGAIGLPVSGLRMRREEHPRPFPGGSAVWSVDVSISPRPAAEARAAFAQNRGPIAASALLTVQAPPSLGPTGGWTPGNTIDVPLPQPLLYAGGTLCIDVTGRPDPQRRAAWPVDAVETNVRGTVVDVGQGCGAFGLGRWSFVDDSTLLPGATVRFSAFGSPGSFALMALGGTAAPDLLPLEPLGSAPGCFGHLTEVLATLPATFSPPVFPQQPAAGGLAAVHLRIPTSPWTLGATFASQWLDLGQPRFAASNAHQWVIASSPARLGMSVVMARADNSVPATGEVVHDLVPVVQVLH